MSQRLVSVVLHGGGPYYLDPLLAAGRVPAIASLLRAGSSRVLRSSYPISASAWVTMLTGLSVGTHGVIDYMQLDARRYHAFTGERADSAAYRDRTVFSVLSGHGRTVASIYLPMTYPPFPVNGFMISGFPLPDERVPPSWPPELSARIGPLTPWRLASTRYERPDRVEEYLAFHLERVERLALETCAGGKYDAVFVCLAVPDLAHHYFWTSGTPEALERIYRVYERVDATVGRLANATPPDAHFVLLSDHGGGPAPTRAFSVNRWLAQEGYLGPAARRAGLVRATNRAVQWAKRLRLNQRLAPLVRGRLREAVSSLTHNDAFVDWGRSRAYGMSFFYPLVGIQANLRGRQPSGIVAPGAEHAALLDELAGRLTALRDPASGRLVCLDVSRREELFAGPHLDRFPDLVARLHPDYDSRTQLLDEAFGPNELQWEYPYMGYHHREGIFAVRGPRATPGAQLPPAEMIDVTPTWLSMLDVPVPGWMEGRPFGV